MKNFINPVMTVIRYVVPSLLLFSSSFIFCMHWFLLMADSHVAGITSDVIPASVLSTIIAYYTVVFGPMTWMIKLVILLTFLSMTLQLAIKDIPWYIRYPIFIIHAPLIVNGVFRIIPLVDKFILNTATPEVQSQIARTVHEAHVISLYGTGLTIVLQIIAIIILQRKAEKLK
jgi:hypothetical protein